MKARFDFNKGALHIQTDLNLAERGITAIFGPSGCGKTSLLRAIAGLDKYSKSEISFAGQQWQTVKSFVPTDQRSVAYVFQEASLFTHLNVQKNLDYAIRRVPSDVQKIPFDQVVELLGIGHLLKSETQTLSGGERQRVALARALLSAPQLLLMDEPLSALDQHAKNEILSYIEQCHKQIGVPIVYVSHALEEVSRLADYLLLMDNGKITHQGTIQQVLTELDSPLALSTQAESIVDGTVRDIDQEYKLAYLDSALGRVTVVTQDLHVGQQVRLRFAARDISLTREPQNGTSILNIFAAEVEQIKSVSDALVTVRLSIRNVPVLARLTKKSVALLQLKKGSKVYAQVKSVAILNGCG